MMVRRAEARRRRLQDGVAAAVCSRPRCNERPLKGGCTMNEIVTDIFTGAWFSEAHGYNFNGYLIRHPAGNLCIDPVPPGGADLADIVRMGVSKILLTNRNHS